MLRSAAGSWRDGEDFLGVEALEVPALIQPTVTVAYDILATETARNIRDDLHTVMDVVGTLAENGFLKEDADYANLLVSLASSEEENGANLRDRLLGILEENAHMAPLATEIRALTGRVVSSVLSSELKNNERYQPVIADVTNSLNQALAMTEEEREEGIRKAVQQAFDAEGIVIPEDLAVNMSEEMFDTCGADGEITAEEVQDYLVERMETDYEAIEQIIESNDLSAFVTALENDAPVEFPY